MQNVLLHRRDLLRQPFLRSVVAVAMWDATVASVAYLVLIPLFAIFVNPLFLLGYVIDLPAVLIPVMITAAKRREIARALASMPGFLALRTLNAVFMLRALWAELVMRRRLEVYEKGH